MKHRYNELKREHGELHFLNDFAEIREVKHLDKPNEPMLRVYRGCPGSVKLQIRTYAPISASSVSRAKAKPRNMIATISIGTAELEEIVRFVQGEQ